MAAIGIDLGTTYSCVAVFRDGTVDILPNDQGNRTTPSYVAFTQTHHLIGESAKSQAPYNARNTVFAVKRLIGRRYDDLDVQMDVRHFPFQVVNDHGKAKVLVDYRGERKRYAPEEISSMILYRMREVAEVCTKLSCRDAVITVPAHFSDAQRQATRTAGAIAGLNVLRIINEPTAAALAYGVLKQLKGEKNVLIYDLGGGTVDVSILKIGDDASVFEVKATAGNSRLGGEDFDARLVAYFARDFEKKFGRCLLSNVKSVRRLRTAAESAKRCLTSATEASVNLESLFEGIDYCGKISRALFEELCSDLFKDALIPLKEALSDARIPKSHIHEVLLVGGSTRIPKIQSMLKEFFDGKQLSMAVNPDEAVAYGAAMQAAVLSGCLQEQLVLIDVVPLSLGVETARGLMYRVVEKNTPIPCQNIKEITTLEDNQPALTIEVFEGERLLTADNNLLGVFELTNIPLAPRGIPKFDIIFDIDADGILQVVAKDKSTGNSNGIVIKHESRASPSEIAKMVSDAKAFREQDKERKLCLEARNQLETYIFNVKASIAEHGSHLHHEEKEKLYNDIELAIDWLTDNSEVTREDLKAKMSELMKKWSGYLSKMYEGRVGVHDAKRRRTASEAANGEDATIEELSL